MLKFQLQFQKLRQCSVFAPGMISLRHLGALTRLRRSGGQGMKSGGTQPFWPKSALVHRFFQISNEQNLYLDWRFRSAYKY
jgi:hypothetical protein